MHQHLVLCCWTEQLHPPVPRMDRGDPRAHITGLFLVLLSPSSVATFLLAFSLPQVLIYLAPATTVSKCLSTLSVFLLDTPLLSRAMLLVPL